jgi:hypothetical protein
LSTPSRLFSAARVLTQTLNRQVKVVVGGGRGGGRGRGAIGGSYVVQLIYLSYSHAAATVHSFLRSPGRSAKGQFDFRAMCLAALCNPFIRSRSCPHAAATVYSFLRSPGRSAK